MKRFIKKDSTDQTIDVFIMDSSSSVGAGLTGLAYNTASLVCYYRRGATGSATALTLATQTVGGVHSDGGFVEISSANMPGWYRLDLSDAIVATGVPWASIQLKGAANMAPCNVEIQMEAAPSDLTHWLGTAAATPTVAGVPEVDVTYVNGSAASGSGTPDVNVVSISGDTTAADTLELFVEAVDQATGQIDSGTFAANAIAAAAIAADARTIFWTTALTESYSTDGATMTGAQALYQLISLNGEFAISGTTITCKKIDGTTTAMTYTLDDATNPTSRTRAT